MTTATLTTPRRTGFLRQLGLDTQYVLLGFPLGIVSVVLSMVGFWVGLGLTVLWIGLPILIGTIYLTRGLAVVERLRAGAVLREELPQPYYRRTPPNSGFWRRLLNPLTDSQSWLDLLHGMFHFIPNTIGFAFTVAWWAGTLGGLTCPLWDWSIPRGPGDQELPGLMGLGNGATIRIWFYLACGVFFALTLVPVLRFSALISAQFARMLLSTVGELRERVVVAEAGHATAREQKDAAVSAETTALRRLERDIHDGPQQRLVRLAMDLGRAQQQFETDPEAAQRTVAEAIAQTRETLDELRALSRGIAPPILVDRGLRAALTALAGRSTVPVELEAPELPDRLAETVESTAYFVVAEALTNIAKHSGATECRIVLHRQEFGLIIRISDNGRGGAQLAKGHGLTGLSDRVRAAGGSLNVTSKDGEGTTLTAAIPL